jgi:dihydrofolate reductase
MRISLIAAASANRVIGKDGGLPWHLPADLAHFKAFTMGHCMVMGRATWEAFPKALPGRTSLVISRSAPALPEGVIGVESAGQAIEEARRRGETELMVIGGGQIYTLFLPMASRIYLTRVHTRIENGGAFFPVISAPEWAIVHSEYRIKDEKNAFDMEFIVLERREITPTAAG